MEKVLNVYPNVKCLEQIGNLYITSFRVFWLAHSFTAPPDSCIEEHTPGAFQYLIRCWKKSEKSTKSSRVRLSYTTQLPLKGNGSDQTALKTKILEFTEGRQYMEEFCLHLHTLDASILVKTSPVVYDVPLSYLYNVIDSYTPQQTFNESKPISKKEEASSFPIPTDVSIDIAPKSQQQESLQSTEPNPESDYSVPHHKKRRWEAPTTRLNTLETLPKTTPSTTIIQEDTVKIAPSISPVDSKGVSMKAVLPEKEETVSQSHAELLKSNINLRNLYSYLVGNPDEPEASIASNVISPTDFWKLHAEEVAAAQHYTPGMKGTENFLSSPPTFEALHGSVTILHGSNDMMESILNEDEKVNKLHKSLVQSGKMSSVMFWERFFQSRYFHSFVGKPLSTNYRSVEEIGGIPLGICEVDRGDAEANVQRLSESVVDLVSSDVLGHKGFGTVEGWNSFAGDLSSNISPYSKTYKPLMERFNKHSVTMVDKVHLEADSTASSVSKRNAEAMQELELEDLKATELPEYPTLALTRQQLYAAGSKGLKGASVTSFSHATPSAEANTFSKPLSRIPSPTVQMRSEMLHPIGNVEFKSSMYETGRHMFIFNTKLCQTERIAQIAALDYDPHTVASVSAHQVLVTELLQHFYSSKVPEEQKRANLILSLESTKQELIASQESAFNRAYGGGSAKALYAPIIEMIDIAKKHDKRMKHLVAELRAKMRTVKRAQKII